MLLLLFFGRLVGCAKPAIQVEFQEMSTVRLGGWQPGATPTKEMLTLISSRMKQSKAKGVLRESANPLVPKVIQEKVTTFIEPEELLRTREHPRCWRCGQRCRFCRGKSSKFPYFGDFRTEIASPFLHLLDQLIDAEHDDEEEEEEELEGVTKESESDMLQCLSGEDFPDSDMEVEENVRSGPESDCSEEL